MYLFVLFYRNVPLSLNSDCMGQENMMTITRSVYREADGIALVFNVTQSETLANVKAWHDKIKNVRTFS